MSRCLNLAAKVGREVAPNPMVLSVIVYDGNIIGEGYHQKFGEAHAEVNTIRSVENKALLKKSTLYVNLEPCSHFGKTPPCADLIIQNNISRVVIGSYDPNPKVAGKGIVKLKNAGVEVIEKVLKKESDYLNRRFITFHSKQRPYIILKWAESKDGFMALNESKQVWLTNYQSKILTHKWRSEEQAILVGRNTVEIDDSELTIRLWQGKNPLRIVIDRNLKISADKKILNHSAKTIVFNEMENRESENVRYIKIDFSQNVIEQILHHLYCLEIQSVIIEGGANTLHHFIQQNLWDEARIFTCLQELKNGKHSPEISGKVLEELVIEDDYLKILSNSNS